MTQKSPAPELPLNTSLEELLTLEERQTMLALLADLRMPVGPPPHQANLPLEFVEWTKPILAYHLMRCGWRPDMARRKIKARRVYGTGTFDGAVVWEGVDEPDDPLANVHNLTVAEIEALEPEDVRNEAKRRVGLSVPAPAQPEGWHTKTRIEITDAPDDEEPPL